MRFKMNRDQYEAIYNLYEKHVITAKPANDAEQLIYDFQNDIYEKMRKKMKAKFTSDWSLVLTPKETLAYKIYWQQAYIEAYIEANITYEKHIINKQLAQIDQAA